MCGEKGSHVQFSLYSTVLFPGMRQICRIIKIIIHIPLPRSIPNLILVRLLVFHVCATYGLSLKFCVYFFVF